MSRDVPHALLAEALELSRELVSLSDRGSMSTLADLDARRLQLLKSFRSVKRSVDAADREALKEIAALNDKALGLVEHHRRIAGRALDLAAVGRRAVAAYANHGMQR